MQYSPIGVVRLQPGDVARTGAGAPKTLDWSRGNSAFVAVLPRQEALGGGGVALKLSCGPLRPSAAALAVAAFAAAPALAQSAGQWPDRPVNVSCRSAGGPADLVGRYVAQQLGEHSSSRSSSRTARERPASSAPPRRRKPRRRLHLAGDGVAAHQPGDPEHRQVLPVDARFHRRVDGLFHRRCSGGASVSAREQRQGVDFARQSKPGGLTYASSGPGSNKRLGGELFKLMSGTDILDVAYKGTTGARNDIIGGHVNMMFDEVSSVAPNVLAGQVRALGRDGAKRSSGLPDMPTVSEAGVPGYDRTLVRHHGSGRDTQADHRPAQRRDEGDGRPTRREGDVGEARHRNHVDDARGVRRPFCGPKSTNGRRL